MNPCIRLPRAIARGAHIRHGQSAEPDEDESEQQVTPAFEESHGKMPPCCNRTNLGPRLSHAPIRGVNWTRNAACHKLASLTAALTPGDWAAAERSKPVHGLSRGWASAIR